MTTYTLRDYQDESVEAGLAYLHDKKRRRRNGIIVAPTGSGKSLLIANMCTRLDGPSIVFQPTKEVLQQNAEKIARYGYPAAVFSASMGRRERGHITLATIGSVASKSDAFEHVRYVLIDECHQAVNPKGGQFTDFLEGLPDHVRVMGFTATPYRLASNSFGSQLRFLTRTVPRLFNDMVHETPIQRLIAGGYWAPLQYHTDRVVVQKERLLLNSTGTDYTDGSVQLHFTEIGFVGKLVDRVAQHLQNGRKHVLVFTRFVDEARRVAEQFGSRAAFVCADTEDDERARIVRDFKSGLIEVVANVGIFGIGFDFPELDCIVLGCPSISLARYYQWCGRVVRPHASKPAGHIDDMVGLVRQFGKIEDLQLRTGGKYGREWEVCSGDRPLTNVYFSDRDGDASLVEGGLTPEQIKKNKKAAFWRKRNRFKKRS